MAILQPNEMLKELAHRYHHFKQENKQKGPESSRNRRHQHELLEIERSFLNILQHWVGDDAPLRTAWDDHFYHFAPRPEGPQVPSPPLFKGVDAMGRRLEVHRRAHRGYTLIIDGKSVRRLGEPLTIGERRLISLSSDGSEFFELFDSSEAAQEALMSHVDTPVEAPPWHFLRELYGDGIVDPNFGLTARGRRLIEAKRSSEPGERVSL
jgi:hypothetical protein